MGFIYALSAAESAYNTPYFASVSSTDFGVEPEYLLQFTSVAIQYELFRQ